MSQMRPEAFYNLENLSDVEIIPFKTAVVGTAIRLNVQKREILIDLGYGFYGIMPEDEVTIYGYTYSKDKDIPHQAISLIGRKVRAIVTSIEKDGKTLKLSRKISMEQSWNEIRENTEVIAAVTQIYNGGIGVDIGNGYHSYCNCKECVAVLVEDLNNWFKIGEPIKVRILEKGNKPSERIYVSHKLAYYTTHEEEEQVLQEDIIAVRVGKRINEAGYFCQYNPAVPGIIDTDKELNDGQIVQGIVKKITSKGLQLKHIEIF